MMMQLEEDVQMVQLEEDVQIEEDVQRFPQCQVPQATTKHMQRFVLAIMLENNEIASKSNAYHMFPNP
jgi:hypothetical protein